jgi:phosphate transport system protein
MTRTVDPLLAELRRMLLRMGSLAEAILDKALRSLWARDAALAAEVARDDLEIDRLDVDIDEAVLRVLALQAPVANDLRHVVAVKMIATDLERVGDLARNIAKSALRLSGQPAAELPGKLRELAEESRRLLRESLDSFSDLDAGKAEGVLREDDVVDRNEGQVIEEAIRALGRNPEVAPQEVDFILVAKNLERVADHATNARGEAGGRAGGGWGDVGARAQRSRRGARVGRCGGAVAPGLAAGRARRVLVRSAPPRARRCFRNFGHARSCEPAARVHARRSPAA